METPVSPSEFHNPNQKDVPNTGNTFKIRIQIESNSNKYIVFHNCSLIYAAISSFLEAVVEE